MYCKNCGNFFENGDTCPSCGTKMADPGKGLGIASLVLGICGLVFSWLCSCFFTCFSGLFPLVLSVVGLILGIVGNNKSKAAGFKNTLATVGLILSIVALAITVLCMFLGFFVFADMYEDIFDYYY